MIIANEGERVCVALWPEEAGPGAAGEDTEAVADEEDDDDDDDGGAGSETNAGVWDGV